MMTKFVLCMAVVGAFLIGCGGADTKDKPDTAADTVGTFLGVSSNPDSIAMVFVKGGTFLMGGDMEYYETDRPKHKVTVSDFYIGRYEITQGQWLAVMGNNPSEFREGNHLNFTVMTMGSDFKWDDRLPVENVSWNDAQEFIQKLNAKTGKKYRLPTEAEWEYAARGGNRSKGYSFSGSNTSDEVSWSCENSGDKPSVLVLDGPSKYYNIRTRPVGTKQPNELGIYDMSGNVAEWVNDWFEKYGSDAQTNPQGPSSGTARVVRGGHWFYGANWGLVYSRSGARPEARMSSTGFRLAHDP
jgi:formylglycine-generating enzyme required for sulfatase activity